jgi:hypothetical protein
MAADDDAFVIPGPPPGAPSPRPEPAHQEPDPEVFITLPPGIVDSATHRVANPRVVTPPAVQQEDEDDSEIVFFPVVPGMPVVTPAPAGVSTEWPAPAAPAAVQLGAPEDADAGETRISPSRHAQPRWRLVLPGGAQVATVTGTVLIGRNPARPAAWQQAELLPVVDPAKSVSKTHAALEIIDGLLWVTDLDSSNGVFIVPADGDAIEASPGVRVAVPAGADLELGDYIIQIEHG